MENSVEARKRKLAYFWAIVTIIACILVGAGVIMHSNDVLPLFLAVGGVLFGPVSVSYTHLDVYKRQVSR